MNCAIDVTNKSYEDCISINVKNTLLAILFADQVAILIKVLQI